MQRTLVLVSASLLFTIASCAADDDYLPPLDRVDASSDAEVLDAGTIASGLPCDVAAVFTTYCASCHGATPAGGASDSLVTRDQLLGDSSLRPGTNLLSLAIARMRDGSMPPAPAAHVPPAEIDLVDAWSTAGHPEGSCSLAPDPFAAPDGCASGTRWTGGNHESPLMRPGGACISCHTSMREGPALTIAGTVYGSGHEVDDCNGAASSATSPVVVEVTDATGRVYALTPNAAGNFMQVGGGVTLPVTARVLFEGRERRMITAATSGDCNGCHTLRGASGAPGRILVP